jgi:ABC-type phosphate transport system substrate-binding protein
MKSLFLILTLSAFAAFVRGDEIALIAHPSVPAESIDDDGVKSFLLGTKTKWPNGPVLKLAVLHSGSVHETVIKTFTNRTAEQFDKYWKKQVFTGQGIMPFIAKTEAEMLDYVASNPGAFGYISRSAATGAVKTVMVR